MELYDILMTENVIDSIKENQGYLFKIIPWVNQEWNIVCWNPDEIERNKLQYMTMGDFAEKIGYERSNTKRLAKILSEVTFCKYGEYDKKHAFL